MSLKAFHLVFITASCAMAFGCGIWELRNFFSPEGRGLDMLIAIAAIAAGVGLVVYERYFLKEAQACELPVRLKALILFLALFAALQPGSLLACSACFGASDSPMAKGMNWGIFSLLAVVVVVLGTIASFFVYLARRAALNSEAPLADGAAPASTT